MGGAGACTRTRMHTRALPPDPLASVQRLTGQSARRPACASSFLRLSGHQLAGGQRGARGWAESSGCPRYGRWEEEDGAALSPENLLGTTEPEHSCIPHLTLSSQGGLGGTRALLPSPLATTHHLMQGFGREALLNTEQWQESSQLVFLDRPAIFQKQGMAGWLALWVF